MRLSSRARHILARHFSNSIMPALFLKEDGLRNVFFTVPSGHTIALGSSKPPTEMSIRNVSWRLKVAGAYG
jgi:hypothetical protein